MSTQTGIDRASEERERALSKLSRRNRDLVQRVMVRHPLLTVEEAIEVAHVGWHIGSRIVIAVVAVAAVVVVLKTQDGRGHKISTAADIESSSQAKRLARLEPTPAQWAALRMEPVQSMTFRSEHRTEGKISINEDRATPIFPPYSAGAQLPKLPIVIAARSAIRGSTRRRRPRAGFKALELRSLVLATQQRLTSRV
jgi:hypothetical protein